ncbi:MAG: hypothetical protein GY793_06085 [Proteobacteria bacterium]|nr:hypothetical protein [Pseudomonadota bacterium]
MLKLFKLGLVFMSFASIALFISACGGGGGSDTAAVDIPPTQEEIVEELGLPPEPDKVTDAATFRGVDSDADDRRDKNEREIAFLFYPDLDAIEQMNKIMKQITLLYEADEVGDTPLFMELSKDQSLCLGCFSFKEYDPEKVLQAVAMFYDTSLRVDKLRKMEEANLSGEGFSFISRDLLEQECPNL